MPLVTAWIHDASRRERSRRKVSTAALVAIVLATLAVASILFVPTTRRLVQPVPADSGRAADRTGSGIAAEGADSAAPGERAQSAAEVLAERRAMEPFDSLWIPESARRESLMAATRGERTQEDSARRLAGLPDSAARAQAARDRAALDDAARRRLAGAAPGGLPGEPGVAAMPDSAGVPSRSGDPMGRLSEIVPRSVAGGGATPVEGMPGDAILAPEIVPLDVSSAGGAGPEQAQLSAGEFTILLGSYQEIAQAEREVARLSRAGIEARYLWVPVADRDDWYRVLAGSFRSADEAERTARAWTQSGRISNARVVGGSGAGAPSETISR